MQKHTEKVHELALKSNYSIWLQMVAGQQWAAKSGAGARSWPGTYQRPNRSVSTGIRLVSEHRSERFVGWPKWGAFFLLNPDLFAEKIFFARSYFKRWYEFKRNL